MILLLGLKVKTPGYYRLHRTNVTYFHHTADRWDFCRRERKCKAPPTPDIFVQIFELYIPNKAVQLHSFSQPLNLDSGAQLCNSWRDDCYTFVKQLYAPCTVAQGIVTGYLNFKYTCSFSTTNSPAWRSVRSTRGFQSTTSSERWYSSRGFVRFCKIKNGKRKTPTPNPSTTN